MRLRQLSTLTLFAAVLLVAGLSAHAQTQKPGAATAKPSAAPVVPSDYQIGPEDVLGIVFWREPDMSGDTVVRPDGRVTLPVIGELVAAGLTPDQLKARVTEASQKFLSSPSVTVIVRQMNSQKVFITGQVTTPGAFPLTGPRTVMQLIALAGGLTEFADSKSITIMREEKGKTSSFKFNYNDVARGRKLEQNILLKAGDTVVVP